MTQLPAITLDFKPSMFQNPNRWCVYGHTTHPFEWPGVPLWIGFCRLADVLSSPDAYAVQEWREIMLAAPVVRLTVFSDHPTEQQAMRAALAMIRHHRPPLNLNSGPTGPGTARRVLCVDTGAVYESAAAAARAHGIFESQMSVYLNRRTAGTIRGLTFKRV